MSAAAPCMRCGDRPAWSSRMCWQCHREYAVELRGDQQLASSIVRSIAIGLAFALGAIGAGAPGFFAIAVVPIAMALGSRATRRHRRAWIEREGPALPPARLLASPREPDSDTRR